MALIQILYCSYAYFLGGGITRENSDLTVIHQGDTHFVISNFRSFLRNIFTPRALKFKQKGPA